MDLPHLVPPAPESGDWSCCYGFGREVRVPSSPSIRICVFRDLGI